MGKSFFSILFFVFLSSFVLFQQAYAQADVNITQTPNPMTVDSLKATITITSKDGSELFTGSDYSYIAWPGDDPNPNPDYVCNIFGYQRGVQGRDGTISIAKQKIEVNIDLSGRGGCTSVTGIGSKWHFRLWQGTGLGPMGNTNQWVVDNWQFTITQAGGNLVTVTAKNPVVYAGEHPIVIITNAVPGQTYSFWWDKDYTITRRFPDSTDKPGQVEIDINNFTPDKPDKLLCMVYGSPLIPPPLSSCTNPVSFKFEGAKPPPAPTGVAKCTLLPSVTPPANSEVNVKIENLPSGTRVASYTVDSKGTQSPTTSGTIDSLKSVTLKLLPHASIGTYKAVMYNEADGKGLCPDINFIVGGTPGAVEVPTRKCGENGVICSKAEGDPCVDSSGRGGGFKTAIGCIHTKPSEFIKDFMTFILGISGGLAFLMMLLGAFQMITSAGNPESLQAGRDRLTSAIIGLLFVIFAVLIMQVIGFDILKIPGFGR